MATTTVQMDEQAIPALKGAKKAKPVVITEKLFTCEVKRRRVRAGGGYEPFWKVKSVDDAIADGDTEFRCKDCHGELKLTKRSVLQGSGSHVTHRSPRDSEYCAGSAIFQAATDGRVSRVSASPVQ